MEEESLKSKTISGMIWKFGERISAQLVSFVVSIIVARILIPEDYGVIAIVSVFINIMNVFVTSGYGAALIQKADSDDNDFNSIFTFSGLLSIVLYFILFFTAPLLANFYESPILTSLVRVMALRLPIASFNSIQQAYVAKKMQFRKFFWATLGGTIASAFVGIGMALGGFGVWALVGQYLTNTVIDTIVLFIQFDWRYKPFFSKQRAVPMIKYGSQVLLATLIDSIYQEIRTLIIGKKYDVDSLAFYNRGEQFPKLIVLNFSTVIDGVLMPTFCKIQDNLELLRNGLKRALQVSTFVIMPLMVGMAVIAESMITVILTEKWLFSVPYVQIFCLSYMFNPLQTSSTQVIKALGKSRLYLILEIIKKGIFLVSLLIAMHFGVYAIALTTVFVSLISCLMNGIVISKLIQYPLISQILDIFPQLLISIVMGFLVNLLSIFINNYLILLVLQVITGIIVYIGMSFMFKTESMQFVLDLIKKLRKK